MNMENRKHLPIGSVVRLKNLDRDLMIVGLFPVVEKEGEQRYFDYTATYLPIGSVHQDNAFFNKEDIEEVIFIGYIEINFQQLLANYEEMVEKINYPKFQVSDFNR
ncbi:TPA: DUF4176 domain-containing protein [Streptococcus suis]